MSSAEISPADTSSLLEENRRLKRAVEELSILNDLARAIGASTNPDEIMGTIIRRSLRAVNAEQGVITLVDEEAGDSMKTLIRENVSSSDHEQFHLNQTLLGWMHLHKKPLMMNDPREDERFRNMRWEETIHSLVCVPLMLKSKLTGVLTVYNKKDTGGFSEGDQRLLAIIAAQSTHVIENARLNEREKQLLKMQEEMRLAAKIQTDLLPKSAPAIAGYDIAGKSIPAQSVGGDCFDFISVDDHRTVLCLGDVSGKGLPASLLMSNVQATLRTHASLGLGAEECAVRSNRLLFQSTSPEKFVTLFYGILDTSSNRMLYTNAGHEHPIVLSSQGGEKRLSTGGIMLGMIEDFPFQEDSVEIAPGDTMVIFSDGVTEAMNSGEVQFGDGRLRECLLANNDKSAADLIYAVVEAIRSHAGGVPQMDDITLVVAKRLPK
jgi:phosphoserine phosphatase RsbU/P